MSYSTTLKLADTDAKRASTISLKTFEVVFCFEDGTSTHMGYTDKEEANAWSFFDRIATRSGTIAFVMMGERVDGKLKILRSEIRK